MRSNALLVPLLISMSLPIAAQLSKPNLPEPTPQQIQAAASMPFRDSSLLIEKRVDDLVSRMSLEEKVSQLIDRAGPIPRLGIPTYNWWSEGLHGIARAGYATLFPQAIGNAATWDTPLLHDIGSIVSIEARAKYNDAIAHDNHDRYYGLTIWSPNINIFRDPRWGRGQETYGEDPFLTSRLGVAFVEGIQGDDPHYFRAIATPKHFAVHSGPESTRHRANVDPSLHDLWDTYLPAFRSTIVEGKADSIMCSYNAVDGVPTCGSKMLLDDILRADWHFGGYVTSDCGAIYDFYQPNGHHYAPSNAAGAAAAVKAGTDLNCGTAYLALTEAVKQKLIPESDIDQAVEHLFAARIRLGMFDPPSKDPYASLPLSEVNAPAHAAIALRAARESMVLLKNENHFLPLSPGSGKTIAVVGPLAASLIALEGNYNAIPLHPILPIDGIENVYGSNHVLYAQGSPYISGGELPVPRTMLRTAGNSNVEGLTAEYFAHPSFDGAPEVTRVDKEIDFDWSFANPVPSLSKDSSNESYAVRWTGMLHDPAKGVLHLQFRLPHCYPCEGKVKFALYIDGKKVDPLAPPDISTGHLPPSGRNFGATQHFDISFVDAKPRALRIEYTQSGRVSGGGLAFEWIPNDDTLRKAAVATAHKADVIVAFVGLTARLEGEEMHVNAKGFNGGDRTDIDLPDVQQQMLESLAKTGKPIIVVLLNGSALAVNWAQQHARAIVEAWYPGQSGGEAIAETLSGKNNPAGRLPVTFYTGIDQLPPFDDYAMANRTYRYFKGKPLFSFGDGLSYTTFAYSNLHLSTQSLHAGDPLTVEADVKNTGSLAGEEVAELYIAPPHTDVSPMLALSGFQRVHLKPGETRHLIFQLNPRTLSQVDDKGNRSVMPGEYKLTVGGSQPSGDAATGIQSATFSIQGQDQLPH